MAGDNGISKDYEISYAIGLTLISFLAIAMYNVVELTMVIFTTFKRRHGLYFYSLLVATWGIIPYCIGFFLKFYNLTSSSILYVTLIAVGWPCMITSQSLVLYSRLHIIARTSVNSYRWVLYMIIADAFICHVPIIVLLYGANSNNPGPFLNPYSIYEKVQISVFFIQEVIISGIYLYKTMQLLRSETHIRGRNSRKVMTHLVWVNVIIIALDVTLLAIEYAGYYDIQTTYKAAVYSVKLKMEFSILNRLLDLFQGRIRDSFSDPREDRQPTATFVNSKKHTIHRDSTMGNGNVALTVPRSTLGNSAYARMDDEGLASAISLKDMEVIKTTEVRIESRARDVRDVDNETMSVGESSTNGQRMELERRASGSSSEIQIVSNGY